MARYRSKLKTFYLHWGPGANAAVEREFFSDLESVHWWDRPIATEASGFLSGVDATERELATWFEQQGPTDIVAHSFGCAVALELSYRIPEKIRSITLMGGNEHAIRGSLQLARTLIRRGMATPELTTTLQAVEQDWNWGTVRAFVLAILAVPNLLVHYWGARSTETLTKFIGIASRIPTIDLTGFLYETETYFWHRENDQRSNSPFSGPVRLLLGSEDPYLADGDEREWRKHFPQLDAISVDAGHFTHFEVSRALWLPES